ncbi:putative chromatin remodeling & transcriptional activation HMG family [Lupinus albus]|uniref:Putative chromatin remodeling & transcriptional activation HMG family n=1 Tax=Lupinus albus TaxID=3870 RepID=A0A6A4QKB8_LUPAL|nr:putative chromatin remodeling & transcriptional activation HMG family [Lupinus albus]
MADIIAQVPTKRARGNRKALKEKIPSTSEANILASAKVSESTIMPCSLSSEAAKQNYNEGSLSHPKKGKAASKKQQKNFEKDLLEMQEKLQQLRLEKEKTEELLKVKDEALKQKEEELEFRDREQEKLHIELKKLHKLKEFKPTMNLPLVKDKEQEKKDRKNGCSETKRPSTPYILWCKDQWNEIKKENPEAEFKEISNMLGAKWKTVSAEEKRPYEEKYHVERETYLQVMANEKRESEAMKLLEEEQKHKTAMELLEQYIQYKQETEIKTKKNKKEKDPLKPKHPMSAYFLFTNDRRPALLAENKKVLEVSKITAEEWKNMTEEQKKPYEQIAKKNKEKYMQEMEAYKQKKDEEAANLMKEEEEHMKLQKQEAMQLLKKKEKTENLIKKTKLNNQKKKKQSKEDKNSDPNKPKRPASSFILFSKYARKTLQEQRPGVNTSTLNALISLKWKELSEEERQYWNGKASEAMEAYKNELEKYNKFVAATASEINIDE